MRVALCLLLAALPALAVEEEIKADVRLPPGPLRLERPLRVVADGITVDLGEAVLVGSDDGTDPDRFEGIGIQIDGRKKVTIRGGKLKGFRCAILARDCEDLVLEGIDVSHNFAQRLRSTPEREFEGDWLWPLRTTTSSGGRTTARGSASRSASGRRCASARGGTSRTASSSTGARRSGPKGGLYQQLLRSAARGPCALFAGRPGPGGLPDSGSHDDASVQRLGKGPGRLLTPQDERAEILAALACIDAVVIFSQDTPLELILTLRPNVLVKGGDYTPEGIVGRPEVLSWGGEVHVIPFIPGRSTSSLIDRIRRLP